MTGWHHNLKMVKNAYDRCIEMERECITIYNQCIHLKNKCANLERLNKLSDTNEELLKLLVKNILALNSGFRLERKNRLQEAFKRLKEIIYEAEKKVPKITSELDHLPDSYAPFKEIAPLDMSDDHCLLSSEGDDSIFVSSESSAISSDLTSKLVEFFGDDNELSFEDFT